MGDERGFGKFDQTSAFNFPTLYGITPTEHDRIYFEELVLNDDEEPVQRPLYRVTNMEKATNSQVSFWRIKLESDFYTVSQIDTQVREIYSFVDYEKQIYQLSDAMSLIRQLDKNTEIGLFDYFDKNFGYYVGT